MLKNLNIVDIKYPQSSKPHSST